MTQTDRCIYLAAFALCLAAGVVLLVFGTKTEHIVSGALTALVCIPMIGLVIFDIHTNRRN